MFLLVNILSEIFPAPFATSDRLAESEFAGYLQMKEYCIQRMIYPNYYYFFFFPFHPMPLIISVTGINPVKMNHF